MRIFTRYAAVMTLLASSLIAISLPANAGEVAYIPLGSDNKLVLVDLNKDKVVGSIKGLPAVHGLAGTPDGKFLIAGSFESRKRGGKTPAKPSGVSPDEHAAHHKPSASKAGQKSTEISTVSIIRTSDRSIMRRIDVPGAVHHVAISPDGRYAVVTHPSEDKISAIDLKSYEVVANFSTGPLPNYAAFSPDGKSVYVSNSGNKTVTSVDVSRWIVQWNAIVGESPEHIVLSKSGARLYVNNVDDGSVSIVDATERKSVKTIKVGSGLHGIDLSEDGKTLFVSVRSDDKLVAIDLATNQSREVALSPSPYHLTAIGGLKKVYVSSSDEPKIWVVDQKTMRVTSEIPIGGKGHQIVVTPGD